MTDALSENGTNVTLKVTQVIYYYTSIHFGNLLDIDE